MNPPTTRAQRRRPAERIIRADAQRNLDALLEAAKAVFAASGVDAPVRQVAARANVGIATLYRHFPQRADLVAAVFRREIDACAAAAAALDHEHEPSEALARWLHRYANFIATTRGLSDAVSGDPEFAALPAYFQQHLEPAAQALLDAAVSAGQVRSDVEPCELLRAVARLSNASSEDGALHGRRMVDLLIDGLRYGAPDTKGLGFMVQSASQFLATDTVIVGILVIAAIAFALELGIRLVERTLIHGGGRADGIIP